MPGHFVKFAAQVHPHVELVQVAAPKGKKFSETESVGGSQNLPQVPQFLGSFVRVLQTRVQAVSPDAHVRQAVLVPLQPSGQGTRDGARHSPWLQALAPCAPDELQFGPLPQVPVG
jgi:hypothetical protein